MGWIVFAAVLALAAGTAPASATVALEISPAAKNEINLGPQSRPGWKPTTEQRQRALKTLQAFLDALESGRHADAYGMLVESFRRQQTLAQFSTETEQFKALAGSAKSWRIVKITWTRDPAQSPQPGTYAALDFSAKFANVDRSCGYFILYQPPAGGDFTIMRRENNYLDNTNARKIEAQHGKAGVEKMWAALSANCPNYNSSNAR